MERAIILRLGRLNLTDANGDVTIQGPAAGVVANGNAAYSSAALSQDFHTITATYSGDTNYPGITSSSLSIGSRFV